MNRFQGRVAIVTGAASGMGFSTARALMQEGARVVLNDMNEHALAQAQKKLPKGRTGSLAVPGNVAQASDVEGLIAETLRRFGRVDILVNNAGILRSTTVDAIPLEEWELVMAVNVTGVFLCSQAVLPAMKKRRYGRIVNLSSSAGRSTSTLGGAHYTTSKAAVLGFTRHLAREMAPHGITANAIAPGLIDTEMVRKNCAPERLERYRTSFPIHRLGTPEEVAALVLFLASEEAGYITGATVDINGGDLMI